jgi:hypothetical protein
MFAKEFRLEFNVTGLVNTVDVTEAGGDGEVRPNFRKSLVHIPNVLWLSVQGGIINAAVVNTYLVNYENFVNNRLLHHQ